MWYSFPFTPSLGLYRWTGRATLNFEPSGHPLPPISPQHKYFHSMERSPLGMPDFLLVVWSTPQPCGTHFRLHHHLAYIHWTGRAPQNFEPSGHLFHPISLQNNYTHSMEGSPLRTSDFILVVWFTPQPRGTHFRLPHHTWLIYTELVKLTKTLNLPYIHFPQLYFNVITPIPWRGLPWAWRILFSSSGSLQNRVVLIPVYPITWLINTELLELHWTLNSPALHFPKLH